MRVSIQKPTDQPTGAVRLLDKIREHLADEKLDTFRFIVAFAKIGPFLRLEEDMKKWVAKGKKLEVIFGVDENGTSLQALEFALNNFSNVYIAHFSKHSFSSTFHPKIYIFTGEQNGIAYIGSNNFTVGGLETNAESNIRIDFETNEEILGELNNCWDSTLAVSRKLDTQLLKELVDSRLVIDERSMVGRRLTIERLSPVAPTTPRPTFPLVASKPPSPIPKSIIAKAKKTSSPESPVTLDDIVTQALAIQVIPHHNGEILLSKLAVDQNPAFFGFPFTGKTNPKKDKNPSYPQRSPDPIVRLTVFAEDGSVVAQVPQHSLTMVYYEAKSEIRITVPSEISKNTPPYSIMVISQNGVKEGLDYVIDIFVPGTGMYERYLADCNQQLPGGGKETPRKFGWI